MSNFTAEMAAFPVKHLETYLADGSKGHIADLRGFGGLEQTPTLLLKTVGRRSGRELITPLVYGKVASGYAVIASKGGADEHPSWYLNLTARPDVSFQVANDRFAGEWRVVEGEERTAMWAKMVEVFPPYAEYEARTPRRIPLILLEPRKTISVL